VNLINKSIEKKRKQLLDSARRWGYTSEQTVQYSKELDELLNMAQSRMMKNRLSVSTSVGERSVVIRIEGDLDIANHELLLEHVENVKNAHNIATLILDCKALSFIDSTGISTVNQLIYLSDEIDCTFQIRGLNQNIRQIFDHIGIFTMMETIRNGKRSSCN
jgi:anti-sigma B factor antagonist